MKVSADRFDLVCIDYFWANVKVREDGSIRTGFHPTVDRHEIDLHHLGANSSTLQRLEEPSVGTAIPLAPDTPLYLSLSTPLHLGEPDLCFTARIGGSIVGTASISSVMHSLFLSRVEPKDCPGHDNPAQVFNIKTSIWAQDPYSKPTHKDHPVFLPVSGDHCWALFVAGQMNEQGGQIVSRCVNCAVENFAKMTEDDPYTSRSGIYVGFL